MKIIIIGINHAGTSALRTLLKQNSSLEITAIDKSDNISFLGCGIALSVSSVVKDVDDLFYSNAKELKKMGANVLMKHEVVNIDTDAQTVTYINLNDEENVGKEYVESYDKLIYAAGSWPIKLNVPNVDAKNIFLCKTYLHALKIIEKANDEAIKSVAIIGAGYIGVELAESFTLKNKKVSLIDAKERVVPNYFDDELCYKLENALNKNGVSLHLGTGVKGFEKNEAGFVTKVKTDTGTVSADLVIVSVGARPNTELLPKANKIPNGAIIVDEHMRSSIDNVYVIGDSAAIFNTASKTFENIALATNAVKGGVVSACHINGVEIAKLRSVVGTNAIHIFGENLSSTGINEQRCKDLKINYKSVEWTDNDRPEFMNDFNKVTIKLIYEDTTLRLLGAQIHSTSNENTKDTHMETINLLALCIQKNMSIIDILTTDVFFLPHYNKPFNFIIGAILKALDLCYVKENY
ncbi:MAG: FAD-dependent oxidoreductase [Mycoplasmoidaceae bacterium]